MATETIETLEDWNKRLAGDCCCTMPLCVEPEISTQKVEVAIVADGFYEDFVGGSDKLYLSVSWDCIKDPCRVPNPPENCGDDESIDLSGTVSVSGILVDSIKTCDGATIDIPNTPDGEDGFGNVYSGKKLGKAMAECTDETNVDNVANEQTEAQFIQKARAFAEGGNFADYYSDCNNDADLTSTTKASSYGGRYQYGEISFTLTRFKFKKPTSEKYKYYKCIYDIYSFYSDRTEEFLKDQEVVFNGDESDFIELAPPPEEGSRKVVNIRFECYRSPDYGNKPQRIGKKVVPSSSSPPP